jgi:CubicO group peptidase (beta-lactamase class C family)
MADTAFSVPPEKLHRFGPLYSYSDQNELTIVDYYVSSPFVRPDPVLSGGCGLVSTLPDYLRFMRMLVNGGTLDGAHILSPHSVAMMTTNQLTGPAFPIRFDAPVPDRGYGFGVSVDLTGRQQVGWIGVSGTEAWLYPKDDLILIAMPQSFLNWEASKTFVNMALASLEG